MIKIFVSQPFKDSNGNELPYDDIMNTRDESIKYYCDINKISIDDIKIIDNYNHKNAPKHPNILWHLGRSIQQMGDADIILFSKDYCKAKGCRVEHFIAFVYRLKFEYVR